MTKKNNSWPARELFFLLLAPLLVLIGVLAFGILLDRWYKDPMKILEFSGIAYASILVLRFIGWAISALSR